MDRPKLEDLEGLEHGSSYCIVGAPASGKTQTLLGLVSELEKLYKPEEILVLTASRRQASLLRDEIALNSSRASSIPRAQSINAFAYRLLSASGSKLKLLSGSNQERLIRSLVLQHESKLKSLGFNPKSIQLSAFIQELRDLLQVVLDFQLSSAELVKLQGMYPSLKLGALIAILDDYHAALASGGWLDSSTLLTAAMNLESSHQVLLVDDAQEFSTAGLELLAKQLVNRTGVIFGDPDSATQGYRAAEPGRFLKLAHNRIYLSRKPALSGQVASLLQRVSSRIPAAGAGPQREVLLPGDPADALLFESTAAEADYLATWLRRSRLESKTTFSEMAVVVRTQSQIDQLSKELALRNVPIRVLGPSQPLATNQLSRAILELAQLSQLALTRERAVAVLQSSLFGLTTIQIRRLDRQLVHHFGLRIESAWTEACELGVELDSFECRSLNRMLDLIRQIRVQPPVSAHQLVSQIFELAPKSLEAMSKSRSSVSLAVNRDLDAALRLFAAAIRFDAQSESDPFEFVNQLLDQRVVEDAIYAEQSLDAVTITTPSNLAGNRFSLVALPRLQDGIWPNLKLRSSMLGATSLRSYLSGRSESPIQDVRGELADELRLFYKALGAANDMVLLTAMQSEDEQPSQFFTMIGAESKLNKTQIDFDLRRFVGRLRQALASGDQGAAGMLALLALADVPGAHPQNWQGLVAPSTRAPIFSPDEQVVLNASSLDSFEKCPLHWFIQNFAVGRQSFQASIGTLLHKALELAKDPTDIQTYVESNWHELEFDLGWQERSQRQRAMQMSALLAQYLADAGAGVGIEEGFELEVGRLRIRGKIDRIEQTEAGQVIADLKTGKSLPDAQSSRQLAIYQLAMMRKVGPENVAGAKLISVGTGKLKVLEQSPLTQDKLDDLDKSFSEFELATSESEIAARFTSHCGADRECSLLLREAVRHG